MKTIEERAKEYAEVHNSYDNTNYRVKSELGFIAGAESEHEELTRWNDLKEVPIHNNEVLIKLKDKDGDQYYNIAFYVKEWFVPYIKLEPIEVIGWREIHE